MDDFFRSLPRYPVQTAELPPPRRQWGNWIALLLLVILLGGLALLSVEGLGVFALVPALFPGMSTAMGIIGLLIMTVFVFVWDHCQDRNW